MSGKEIAEVSVEAEAEALAMKYPNKNPGFICGVAASGHRSLIEALGARGLKSTRILKIMEVEKGTRVSYQTIRRHLAGVCSCQR